MKFVVTRKGIVRDGNLALHLHPRVVSSGEMFWRDLSSRLKYDSDIAETAFSSF